MEEVRNKAMVFKVSAKADHFKNRAMPIPVVGITYDAELVHHYCPSLVDDQDHLSIMLDEDDQDGQSEESESGDEASSPNVTQTKKQRTAENNQALEVAETKRNLIDQFSSTKDVKKSKPVVVKLEKN
ncbi:PREDICTED: uncharacterized protein LOC109192956 [Ipomoea nil]|nr:PREDICTED: uncharacterized protein LOC109163473 [Ipomoea nil]XP_019186678.1 PREDICTED: uncharacterized protein LOC109181383 [Ipomoea nil]XP_019195518.1 PREDICTED: uncharacterized protein LOC109189187 [Ipomoea nil]XP_019199221.1 PREDICTED: uncharacterized protein LOC109192956 [Ipomoea nil]